MNTFTTLVVPLAYITTVNALCFAIAGQAAGESMLRANVNANGTCKEADATHAVASGVIDAQMFNLMQDPTGIVLKSKNAIALNDVIALLAACDISQDPTSVALDRVYDRTPIPIPTLP